LDRFSDVGSVTPTHNLLLSFFSFVFHCQFWFVKLYYGMSHKFNCIVQQSRHSYSPLWSWLDSKDSLFLWCPSDSHNHWGSHTHHCQWKRSLPSWDPQTKSDWVIRQVREIVIMSACLFISYLNILIMSTIRRAEHSKNVLPKIVAQTWITESCSHRTLLDEANFQIVSLSEIPSECP
jgi:hypothetical protein